MISDDTIILGLLFAVLGFIFATERSDNRYFKKFYAVIPSLLLCYFIPGLLNTFGIIDGENSKLYFISSRYLLPACLVLLTLSVDLKGILKLGPKAIIMFFTGTIGVILGGPIALISSQYLFPEMIDELGLSELWAGMTTIAGSWIGGGANQASMKEIFNVSDSIFSMMVVIDVFVANIWMAILLFLAAKTDRVDTFLKADVSAIHALKDKMVEIQKRNTKVPGTSDFIITLAVAFGAMGISHYLGDLFAHFFKNYSWAEKFSFSSSFFWLIVIATTIGVLLSFTKAKKLEGVGASKLGNVLLYILIASIGMQMDILQIFKYPHLITLGLIWMSVHALLMLVVGKLIRAPFFFIAVGSQANIGGAASAPVVASVFHESLAPVGVLLAVLGYVVGTYGAWLCGMILIQL